MADRINRLFPAKTARACGSLRAVVFSVGPAIALLGVMSCLCAQLGLASEKLPLKKAQGTLCSTSPATTQAARLTSPIAQERHGGFIEDFTGNTGLARFRLGVYHRNIGSQMVGEQPHIWGDNNAMHGGEWTADHDLNCGLPDTQRVLSSRTRTADESNNWVPIVEFNLDQIFYLCRDHLMTSMGDVDGYSIIWFSPNRQFRREIHKRVSWDVNVTNLGARQWWEVSIVPVGAEFLATAGSLADTAGIAHYNSQSVIVGSGPLGGTVNITTNNKNRYDGWRPICGQSELDPEGCASKMLRRTFSIIDNNNDTLTVDYGGLFKKTVPGRFPERFEVYFKDHNYTPDKDGMPAGHTWHWDTIRIE